PMSSPADFLLFRCAGPGRDCGSRPSAVTAERRFPSTRPNRYAVIVGAGTRGADERRADGSEARPYQTTAQVASTLPQLEGIPGASTSRDHSSKITIAPSTVPSPTVNLPTATGSRNRRGPALPGLK